MTNNLVISIYTFISNIKYHMKHKYKAYSYQLFFKFKCNASYQYYIT